MASYIIDEYIIQRNTSAWQELKNIYHAVKNYVINKEKSMTSSYYIPMNNIFIGNSFIDANEVVYGGHKELLFSYKEGCYETGSKELYNLVKREGSLVNTISVSNLCEAYITMINLSRIYDFNIYTKLNTLHFFSLRAVGSFSGYFKNTSKALIEEKYGPVSFESSIDAVSLHIPRVRVALFEYIYKLDINRLLEARNKEYNNILNVFKLEKVSVNPILFTDHYNIICDDIRTDIGKIDNKWVKLLDTNLGFYSLVQRNKYFNDFNNKDRERALAEILFRGYRFREKELKESDTYNPVNEHLKNVLYYIKHREDKIIDPIFRPIDQEDILVSIGLMHNHSLSLMNRFELHHDIPLFFGNRCIMGIPAVNYMGNLENKNCYISIILAYPFVDEFMSMTYLKRALKTYLDSYIKENYRLIDNVLINQKLPLLYNNDITVNNDSTKEEKDYKWGYTYDKFDIPF